MATAKKRVAIGLAVVVLLVGGAVGWSRYQAHKKHLREEEVLSFLVDEFVKSDGEDGLMYKKTDVEKCSGKYKELCEWANTSNLQFVKEHAAEMNEFIWNHQADPRVPQIQTVMWSWDLDAKLTCEQMRNGVPAFANENNFKVNYSKYEMYKAGCL
jgi:hypothetical protein